MKFPVLFTLLFLSINTHPACAMTVPLTAPIRSTDPNPLKEFVHLKPREWEQRSGKRMTLLEKLQYKVIQYGLRKQARGDDTITERQKKQAKLSMIFGLSSIGALIIPFLGLFALPAAVAAVVLGIKSLKGNSNTQGMVGLIAGSVCILLFIAGTILILALLAGGGW